MHGIIITIINIDNMSWYNYYDRNTSSRAVTLILKIGAWVTI